MSLENRLHLRSYSPDLLVEFDLPPGTHATIGASPEAEISLPLTGIPQKKCILGRFQDGRVFLGDLDFCVSRRLDLPDILVIPPYKFHLFHPAEPVPEAVANTTPDGKPSQGKSRDQIASRIRALFRKPHEPAPPAD